MSEYIQQGDATNFAGKARIIYCKKAVSGSEQLLFLTKAQKREEIKGNRAFIQLVLVFKYFVY